MNRGGITKKLKFFILWYMDARVVVIISCFSDMENIL